MKRFITKKRILNIVSIFILLLAIWKILAVYFHSDFIIPHPEDTFLTAIRLLTDMIF